jgi:hypothetical protein
MLNNGLLHTGPDINQWRVRRKRMMIPTLILIDATLIVFGVIVKVWEVLIIVVIMILLLKQSLP